MTSVVIAETLAPLGDAAIMKKTAAGLELKVFTLCHTTQGRVY
jgi:hypothetical protein